MAERENRSGGLQLQSRGGWYMNLDQSSCLIAEAQNGSVLWLGRKMGDETLVVVAEVEIRERRGFRSVHDCCF